MNDEIIIEVVQKLIGPVEPVGCSRTDADRLENLKTLCSVVDRLVSEIDNIQFKYALSYEASVKAASEYASKFLTSLGIVE